MPYTIVPRDGQHCVYKADSDGAPVGESLGCHGSVADAEAQVGALYANEGNGARKAVVVPMRRVTIVDPEGIIEGHLAVWGTQSKRDDYGTWFDREHPPELNLDLLPHALMYEHSLDGELRKKRIGEVFSAWPTSDGIKYRAKLDRARLDDDEFGRIVSEIRAGDLATSSATAGHLMEFDDEGRFVNWPISEISLTKYPAEPRMPTVALVRSNYDLQHDTSAEDALGARGDVRDTASEEPETDGVGTMPEDKTKSKGQQKPTNGATRATPLPLDPAFLDPLNALIDQWGLDAVMAALDAMNDSGDDEPAPTLDADMMTGPAVLSQLKRHLEAQKANGEVEALRQQVDALTVQMQAEQPGDAPPPRYDPTRGDRNPHISVVAPRRFAGRSAADLATAYMVKLAQVDPEVRKVPGYTPMSPEFMRVLAHRTLDEIDAGKTAPARNLRAEGWVRFRRSDIDSADPKAWSPAIRADIMGSDVTGYGDEWVAVFYEDTLWEKIRIAPVWEMMREKGLLERDMPRGYESTTIPLEGADPTWYYVSQASDVSATGYPERPIPVSKTGTSNKSISTSIVAASVPFTTTLEEDSIIQIAPQVRRQMEVSGREQVEYLLINGDTTTTASSNINLVDGTPAATASYLAMDGMLHLPLITTTANARDAGTTFDEDDFRLLLKLLGTNGQAAHDRTRLMWVMDVPTQDAAIAIPAFKTQDVYSLATIESGELVKAWNVQVLVSGQMALANSSGKISATASNNTKGRLLLVRPDQWAVGYKRQMMTEVQRDAISLTTFIVSSMRIGMAYRDSDTAAAISYNVTV